jgi:biopolymer transport protein ExbD/biopolymer transport protein TolR
MIGLPRPGALQPTADINVTSLVDVAFVLLIIFMITAPIMQGGVDVQLPEAEVRPIQPKEGLIVTIDSRGRIFVGENAQLSYTEFRTAFPALARSRGAQGVYLRADRRVDYGQVVRVLAVMRSAGVHDVGLVAEEEEIRR